MTSGDADLKPFQIELNFFLHLARHGCRGVKYSPRHPKVQGSNPGIAPEEKIGKNHVLLTHWSIATYPIYIYNSIIKLISQKQIKFITDYTKVKHTSIRTIYLANKKCNVNTKVI